MVEMNIRVLHVDDNPRERAHFMGIGAALGWRVTSTSDGMQGLLEAAKTKFDLIVSDVAMPRLNGPEMIGMIRRSDSINRATSVILVSCKMDEAIVAQAERLGIESTLPKPLLQTTLREEAERLLAMQMQPAFASVEYDHPMI